MKRNEALIKKWVAALRSGKYHKAHGQLCEVARNQTFHCCLGVACRVAAKNGLSIKTGRSSCVQYDGDKHLNELDGDTTISFEYKDYSSDVRLPDPLRRHMGLTIDEQSTLMTMNDRGDSFSQIADWIEQNILRSK